MAYRDWGSKTGGGGVASRDHENLARKERLRQLALDTVDLKKDPYFMRNHLGTYECKLCLTLHANEANYLAHTQGKRHQSNLKRRAAMEMKKESSKPRASLAATSRAIARRRLKIGRPGYRIIKQREPETSQFSILFQVQYPKISAGLQPRHRFMSAFEQKVEKPDKRFQYIIFAAEPYETVAFKIPNMPIDKSEGRFYTNWDRENLNFTLQLFFEPALSPSEVTEDQGHGNATNASVVPRHDTPQDPFAGLRPNV